MRSGGGELAPLALALLATVGSCTPDFCSQLQSLDWSQTLGSCSDAGGLPSPGSCAQELASCNSADQSALNGYESCLQRLPVCPASQQASWDQAFLSCGTLLQQLSTGCPFVLPGGRQSISGNPPGYSDGGCAENTDCAPVNCPCADEDAGTNPFQACVDGGCDQTCPEVSCCDDLAQEPTGSVCNGPCLCASMACNAGICE